MLEVPLGHSHLPLSLSGPRWTRADPMRLFGGDESWVAMVLALDRWSVCDPCALKWQTAFISVAIPLPFILICSLNMFSIQLDYGQHKKDERGLSAGEFAVCPCNAWPAMRHNCRPF